MVRAAKSFRFVPFADQNPPNIGNLNLQRAPVNLRTLVLPITMVPAAAAIERNQFIRKAMEMRDRMTDITWELKGNELIAL